MGEHWKIERKYRRILNKKIAGKVRTQVREQQEKLDDLERIASNKQKNLAKEVSKMVQKEFWNKVEKVALLFHEKRNGYLDFESCRITPKMTHFIGWTRVRFWAQDVDRCFSFEGSDYGPGIP